MVAIPRPSGFLQWRRERRERRAAAHRRPPVLATYTSELWHQRHRRLCIAALIVICLFYGFTWTLFGRFLLPTMLLPYVFVIGLIIWLLPEQERAPEHILRTGLFAYLVALLCWPDYIAVALPGLPWITFIRLIGLPLALVTLVSLSISSAMRERGKEILSSAPLVWKFVATFGILCVLSVGLSESPLASLQKALIAQINWTLMFFLGCFVFVRPGNTRRLAYVLWAVLIYVSLIGLWESRISRLPWAGHIPSFLAIEDESVQRTLAGVARAGSKYRVQSKFATSLGLAEYLAVVAPFILHFVVTGRTFAVRAAAAATVPLLFYMVYLTDSRLGAIGLFISLALYLFYWAVMQWRRRPERLLGRMITLSYPAIVAVLFASTLFVARFRAQIWGNGSQQSSTDARRAMYENGIPLVLKNPIGHGFGQGALTLGYQNGNGVLTIDTYYLAVALDVGVVGFVAFYGAFIAACWYAASTVYRHPEADEVDWLGPITIALMNFVVIKSVFSGTENHPLLFILLGILVALCYRARVSAGLLPRQDTPAPAR